ncbi:MAG: TlpA family protein disulfide reductase [Bacteroidales bacterium]|nr:TlpA family protein disulfide reductase [Bacteroidales bacterium]
MKKLLFFAALLLSFTFLMGQNAKLPSVNIKDMEGKVVNTSSFSNDGKPYVICFWATWCHPCLQELSAMAELYDDWRNESGMKIYAISLDDTRTKGKVKPTVNSQEWSYEVMIDENSDFKRAMGVNNPPHTFIIGSDGTILWQHTGYAEGDEENLLKKYIEFLE